MNKRISRFIIVISCTCTLYAQDPKVIFQENRFSAVIDLLSKKGVNGTEEEKKVLLQALKARADLLMDAAYFFDDLGYHFYTYRDTARASDVARTRNACFFRGRCAYELNKKTEAREALKRARSLSAPYGELAGYWLQALDGGAPQVQAQAAQLPAAVGRYIAMRQGQDVTPLSVTGKGAMAQGLQLWAQAYTPGSDMSFTRNALYKRVPPDLQETVTLRVTGQSDKFSVDFYDPMVFHLMAMADYLAGLRVAESMENRNVGRLMAGICAYFAGRYQKSEELLGTSTHDMALVYRGGLAMVRGQQAEAEGLWLQAAEKKNVAVTTELRRVAGPYGWKKLNLESAKDLSLAQRARLGEALMRQGRYKKAIEWLDPLMDMGHLNSLKHHDPSYILVLAHAEFLNYTDMNRVSTRLFLLNFLGALVNLSDDRYFPFLGTHHDCAKLIEVMKGNGSPL